VPQVAASDRVSRVHARVSAKYHACLLCREGDVLCTMPLTATCTSAVKNTLSNSESTIESIAKVDGDGILLKVNRASEGLVNRLRQTFPLATVALAEDLCGSTACAHVLFPSIGAQRNHALSLARGMRLSRTLLLGSNCFLFMALLVFVTAVVAGLRPPL
jgi:hypothetical protein